MLLQAVINSIPAPTFAAVWLETPLFNHDGVMADPALTSVPLYIKSILGHSGSKRIKKIHDADWEIKPEHTTHLYHSGYRHNLDSILRNGIIAGGPSRDQKRHQCFFSIADPKNYPDVVTGRPELGKQPRSKQPIYGVSHIPYSPDKSQT